MGTIQIKNLSIKPNEFHEMVRKYITDCNKCRYIDMTEKEQNAFSENKLKDHNCLLHSKRVLHGHYHPALKPCDECDGKDFKDFRQ